MFQDIDLSELGYGTTELTFEDKSGMQFITRRTRRTDRYVPLWSVDDKKIQLVLYSYMWNYCSRKLSDTKPGCSLADLEKSANQYRHAIRDGLLGMSSQERRNMEQHLESTENGVLATTARLIYMAYRQRLIGIDIASELRMTPQAVRTKLWRLNELARKLFPQEDQFVRHHTVGRISPSKSRKGKKFEQGIANGQLRTLAQRYNAGETLYGLAEEVGWTAQTLHNRMNKFGLINPKQRPTLRKPVYAALAKRYNAGESLSSLAKEVDRAPSSLYFSMRRHVSLKRRYKSCRTQSPLRLLALAN